MGRNFSGESCICFMWIAIIIVVFIWFLHRQSKKAKWQRNFQLENYKADSTYTSTDVNHLVSSVNSADRIIKQAAIRGLRKFKQEPKAINALSNFLETSDYLQPEMFYAAESLGLLDDQRATEKLLQILENKNIDPLTPKIYDVAHGLGLAYHRGAYSGEQLNRIKSLFPMMINSGRTHYESPTSESNREDEFPHFQLVAVPAVSMSYYGNIEKLFELMKNIDRHLIFMEKPSKPVERIWKD